MSKNPSRRAPRLDSEILADRNAVREARAKQNDPNEERVNPELIRSLLLQANSPLIAPKSAENKEGQRRHRYEIISRQARRLLRDLFHFSIPSGDTSWDNADLTRAIGDVMATSRWDVYDAVDDVLTLFLRERFGLDYRAMRRRLATEYERHTGKPFPRDTTMLVRTFPLPLDEEFRMPRKDDFSASPTIDNH